MKGTVSLVLLLLAAAKAGAITWNFDTDGDAQGWISRVGVWADRAYTTPLRSEVANGCWRIYFPEDGLYPALEMISPLLNHDSALFDQFRIRFRLVHFQPMLGSLALSWTNATNEDHNLASFPAPDSAATAGSTLIFSRSQSQLYSPQWQEVTIGRIQSEVFVEGKHIYNRVWEGELLDVRPQMLLYTESPNGLRQMDSTEMPEALEIDWIRLTGIEEQLQGELPPPSGGGAISLGQYFAPPVFYPLDQHGVGWEGEFDRKACLADFDGDGDVDLAAGWKIQNTDSTIPDANGWMLASGDGRGGFTSRPALRTQIAEQTSIVQLDGADLDDDGAAELMVGSGFSVQLFDHHEKEWVTILTRDQVYPLGLGDVDGDGDSDLWLRDFNTDGRPVVLLNDGRGRFSAEMTMAPELIEEGLVPQRLVRQMMAGIKTVGLMWGHFDSSPVQGYKVTYLDQEGDVRQVALRTEVIPSWVRYVGDLDQDGDLDLAAVAAETPDADQRFRGLDLLVNPGDGQLVHLSWYGREVEVWEDVRFVDLNGDGYLDPVFTDQSMRGSALVVGVGQKEGMPIQEGRYSLDAGGIVLNGDLDGDRDADLAVLYMKAPGGQSGVNVFVNQLPVSPTVVSPSNASLPAVYGLGLNYPNPFNPQTWIPFTLPAGDASVVLRVYDLLGQPIRTLVSGRLTPGSHAVPWDGRDDRGAAVSSGVYLYHLEAGTWQGTGRMVKNN